MAMTSRKPLLLRISFQISKGTWDPQYNTKKEIVKDGNNIPITQKIKMPKIEGAIVTAIGAKDINIKKEIIQAVCAVTGLATYRVQVFQMGEN